jgi:hypothetical protein
MHLKTRVAIVPLAATVLTALGLPALVGCGIKAERPPTNYVAPIQLAGNVMAGKNYMAYATVNIYITQPDGIATNGSYVGSAKLLQTLTTGPTGAWTTETISCSSPDQIYVTAVGGTPYPSGQNATTLSANPNSVMMTAIGDCSILTNGSNPANLTNVITNEASTVAAVYALRNFISIAGTTVNVTAPATNYAGTGGVGAPGSFAGLAHAFLNANNLSPYKQGAFPQYTNGAIDATGGGILPVQELNSLAYMQYLCTVGGTSGAEDFSLCNNLYSLATPPGGTAPTNSLAAMLNIASYPANNAAALMAFQLTPIPYTGQTTQQVINAGVYVPALSAFGTLTNDWTVALFYGPGYGNSASGQVSVVPQFVTIDANDDVFFANPAASSSSTAGNVIAITSNGQNLWTSATDTTQVIQPHAIAADASGNIWVVNDGTGGYVEQINAATGAAIKVYTTPISSLYGLAVDSLGNVWYDTNVASGQNLHELLKTGTTYTEQAFTVPPDATYQLVQVRPDSNNNIWVGGYLAAGGAAVYLPNTGTAAAPTYTAGFKYAPITGASSTYGVAPDANGNAYVIGNGTPGELNKIMVTGTGSAATLAASGVATVVAATPTNATAIRFMDIDGAGTIWFPDNTTGTKLYGYVPSNNTITSYYPCYNAGTTTGTSTAVPPANIQTCTTGISTRFDLAIDSTGTMWVASYGNSGGGRVAQIIGLAAPTVPLKSLGRPGQIP